MNEEQPYVMPKVYLGQWVIWYAAPGSEGAPACVTKTGSRHLTLAVVVPGFQSLSTPDGVLHISDPQVKKFLENDAGVWDYSDWDKYLLSVIDQLRPVDTKLKEAAK
jgi:hypothetical protein